MKFETIFEAMGMLCDYDDIYYGNAFGNRTNKYGAE